MKGITIFAGLT